jgi:3-methyladenine DNA glycosylase AlkD
VPRPRPTDAVARDICRHLRVHGSAEHAAGVQWFFKEQVRSHGWYTADLRRYARALHKDLAGDQARLVDVAESLFARPVLEEKATAVLMLQPSLRHFGSPEFRRFERWLDAVASWADHDALAMYLLGPMIVADPTRVKHPLKWASSTSRWRRRAAAVSLIHGIRRDAFASEATAITMRLLTDRDDMVQKGLGWLLREWAKYRPTEAVPVLLRIRDRAPRLVLRTGCEKLGPSDRQRILGR